jgi:nitrate/nitrite transporter NarK
VPPVLSSGLAVAAGSSPMRCWAAALGNYRTWLLGGAYALCFGVELVVNNVLVKYLYDSFALDLTTAGAIGEAGRAWGGHRVLGRGVGGGGGGGGGGAGGGGGGLG